MLGVTTNLESSSMRCDTCQKEAPIVLRVVVAKGYDRSLSRPIFNCPECFEKKEQAKQDRGSSLRD